MGCTGSHMRLKARSIRSRSFIRGEPFFQIRRLIPKTFYVYSTGVPKSINTVRKFRGAPVTLILNAGRPHPPPSELECPSDETLRFAFEDHTPPPAEVAQGFTVQPHRPPGSG